jgi:hypothetical protein
MVWLFALGIIWLAIVHEGFRKLLLVIGGLGSGAIIAWVLYIAATGQQI